MDAKPIDEAPRAKKAPLRQSAVATVEAILEAAIEVFVRVGYARMTTNTVARRAGVSIGSLYQYFGDKHAIVAEVARRAERRGFEAAKELSARTATMDARQACAAWVDLALDPRLGSPALQRALLLEIPAVWILEARREVNAGLEQTLGESMRAMTLRPGDARLMAFVVHHAISGVVQAVLRQRPDEFDSPTLRDELVRLAWHYLAPEGAELAPEARPERAASDPLPAAQIDALEERPAPKTKRARATVDAIVAATARILQEQGFEGLGARAIAKEAGLSPGALYRYFANVPAILGELARRNDERILEQAEETLSRAHDGPLRDAVAETVTALCTPSHAAPEVRRALLLRVPRRWFLHTRIATSERLQAALRPALVGRADEVRRGDLRTIGFVTAHAVSATIEAALSSDVPGDALAEEITELVVRYLSPRAG